MIPWLRRRPIVGTHRRLPNAKLLGPRPWLRWASNAAQLPPFTQSRSRPLARGFTTSSSGCIPKPRTMFLARSRPDPFMLHRLTFLEASVDVCEVLSSSPNGSAPFLDGIRFEALRALCSRSHLRGIAEAIANLEVPSGVAHFLSSATLVPLDKLTPAERNALELSAGDMKGSVRPIGIGGVLVR
eukprot:jgi/Tetstr1/458984/TSEL_004455.t1